MDDDNDESFESIVVKDEDIFTDNSYDNDPEPVLSGNITETGTAGQSDARLDSYDNDPEPVLSGNIIDTDVPTALLDLLQQFYNISILYQDLHQIESCHFSKDSGLLVLRF